MLSACRLVTQRCWDPGPFSISILRLLHGYNMATGFVHVTPCRPRDSICVTCRRGGSTYCARGAFHSGLGMSAHHLRLSPFFSSHVCNGRCIRSLSSAARAPASWYWRSEGGAESCCVRLLHNRTGTPNTAALRYARSALDSCFPPEHFCGMDLVLCLGCVFVFVSLQRGTRVVVAGQWSFLQFGSRF